jgi:small subunit ribosomal protein S16
MLAIRFLRSGRTNKAFFRIVVTESSKPPKSGFLKILGWYDPHTKETSLNKEEIIRFLDNGAKASNSVAKLLNANGVKHKMANFIKDKEKAKKAKGEPKPKPVQKPEDTEEASEKPAEKEEQVEEVNEEAPQDEKEVPASEEATEKEAEKQDN